MYYTYIIRTEGGALYTGIAKNLFSRMKDHASQGKRSAKFTRSHKILSLEALWSGSDRSAASRLEYAIKQLSKKEKEALILTPSLFSKLLPHLEKEDFIHHPKACLALYRKEIDLAHLP